MIQGISGHLELFTSSSVTEEECTVGQQEDIPTCGAQSVAIADYDNNGELNLVFSNRYDQERKAPIE